MFSKLQISVLFLISLVTTIFMSENAFAAKSRWPSKWPRLLKGSYTWEVGLHAECSDGVNSITEDSYLKIECKNVTLKGIKLESYSGFKRYRVSRGTCTGTGFNELYQRPSEEACEVNRYTNYSLGYEMIEGTIFFSRVTGNVRAAVDFPTGLGSEQGTMLACGVSSPVDELVQPSAVAIILKGGVKVGGSVLQVKLDSLTTDTFAGYCGNVPVGHTLKGTLKGKVK